MDLIYHLRVCEQPLGQSLGELKAEIDALCADVKQQVARRCHGGVAVADQLFKRVQARRARLAEQPVPEL